MTIEVASKKVFSNRDATPDEQAAGVEYISGGSLREPDLIDRDIEDGSVRSKLDKDQGNIAITVLPGENLGQLSVNVQFEGKSGEREICLQEQDKLLQEAAVWLEDILSDFGCDFKADIEALPCPHAVARLQIGLATKRLMGLNVESSLTTPGPRNEMVSKRRI